MKKIISLIITLLFVFNLLPSVFAMQQETVDINSFDNFSIEQVQKTFSNTLSQEQASDNQNNEEQNLYLNEIFCNVQNISSLKLSFTSNVLFSESNGYGLNYLYQYKLFEKKFQSDGISEYKINFNSYIATALFDIYGVVFHI